MFHWLVDVKSGSSPCHVFSSYEFFYDGRKVPSCSFFFGACTGFFLRCASGTCLSILGISTALNVFNYVRLLYAAALHCRVPVAAFPLQSTAIDFRTDPFPTLLQPLSWSLLFVWWKALLLETSAWDLLSHWHSYPSHYLSIHSTSGYISQCDECSVHHLCSLLSRFFLSLVLKTGVSRLNKKQLFQDDRVDWSCKAGAVLSGILVRVRDISDTGGFQFESILALWM